jgi:hypothetical protein
LANPTGNQPNAKFAKAFWFLFQKRTTENKRFFLKKEAILRFPENPVFSCGAA